MKLETIVNISVFGGGLLLVGVFGTVVGATIISKASPDLLPASFPSAHITGDFNSDKRCESAHYKYINHWFDDYDPLRPYAVYVNFRQNPCCSEVTTQEVFRVENEPLGLKARDINQDGYNDFFFRMRGEDGVCNAYAALSNGDFTFQEPTMIGSCEE
jgi:hypothetical protein